MAIDFPDSPAVNDTHAYIERTWKYDGTDWVEITPEVETTPEPSE